MTVREITTVIEEFAPLGYQESYDNAGLIIGAPSSPVSGILLALDVTLEVIDEALSTGANLIVAHHPLIFKGIKRLTGANATEQTVIKAIQQGIAVYCSHTNLDMVWGGVSAIAAQKIGLTDIEVLAPTTDQLVKLTAFVPHSHLENIRIAMFKAGAGSIGNYDQCSYNVEGQGTFRANDQANPYVGTKGEMHQEPETRVEVIVPKPILSKVIDALIGAHPYEEVAYDIYQLLNKNPRAGLGVVGNLTETQSETDFLQQIKHVFGSGCIKHSPLTGRLVERVAICGGSGAELIAYAIAAQANVFITGDVKYHHFFDAEDKLVIADVGHFESEQFALDIFYELLTKKFPNFAVLKSKVKTNPINYA